MCLRAGQRRDQGSGEAHAGRAAAAAAAACVSKRTSINGKAADTFQSLWKYGMWAIVHWMFTNEHFAQALSHQLLVLGCKSHTFVLCL